MTDGYETLYRRLVPHDRPADRVAAPPPRRNGASPQAEEAGNGVVQHLP